MEVGTYYHKFNALKFRILVELFNAKKRKEVGLTCQQIADALGVDRHRITNTLCKWHRLHYKYVRRLPKKQNGGNGKAYRYSITEYGEKTAIRYSNRYHEGYDLNIMRKPRQTETLIDITYKGRELGYTVNDVWKLFDDTKKTRKVANTPL